MRCACVDVGSNTTRLLVAEPDGPALREIAADRVFTRIGAACAQDGTIPAATVEDVVRVVAAQVSRARDLGAQRVRVVATAAVRDAANGPVLSTGVRDRTGLGVEVLSGEEEARLAFLGATGACPGAELPRLTRAEAERPVAVVDVGGGSTELVVGTPAGGVEWVVSLPIGSGVLGAGHGPAGSDGRALDALRVAVAEAFADVVPPPVDRAVAVGGSAGSLRLLVGDALTPAALDRALGVLAATPADELVARHGLHPERIRMLPAGLTILAAAGRVLAGAPLRVGRGGLREGVILRELGADHGPIGAARGGG